MINEYFIERLLAKAGFADDENMELLIDDVRQVLYDRVMAHIANQFGEKEFKEFNALVEKKADEDEIYDYLKKTIPEYESFIQKVYDNFEKMYLSEFKEFKKEFQKKE